jgi:hypothetical protein
MRRLTNEELAEGDVALVMTHAQYDALPAVVYEQLRLYVGRDDGRRITYRVPAYVYREMEAMGARQEGGNDRQ